MRLANALFQRIVLYSLSSEMRMSAASLAQIYSNQAAHAEC